MFLNTRSDGLQRLLRTICQDPHPGVFQASTCMAGCDHPHRKTFSREIGHGFTESTVDIRGEPLDIRWKDWGVTQVKGSAWREPIAAEEEHLRTQVDVPWATM